MNILIFLTYVLLTCTLFWGKTNGSPLVWVSLDALGKWMISEKDTPFLHKLFQKTAGSLVHHPNYITKTFPNHFSAATGLNIEDHQIVGNHMIDSNLGSFSYSNNDPAWWNPNGDTFPIWTLNEMYNKRGSAIIYWPGSSVPYGNNKKILPKYHIPGYDSTCGCACRLNYAYNKIISGEYELVMVYIDDIDQSGHSYGTKSSHFIQTLLKVDKLIENFFNKITKNEFLSSWNLIISSDHGMTDLDESRTLLLKKILPGTLKYRMIIEGSQGQLKMDKKSDIDTVVKLISLQKGVDIVATPETMPEEYKYSNSKRIPDITIIMKEGWAVTSDEISLNNMVIGDHGYPSKIAPSMYAIMMGYGKNFRSNIKVNETKMTDLFGVACYVLEIEKYCKIDQLTKSVVETLVFINVHHSDDTDSDTKISGSINALVWIIVFFVIFVVVASAIGRIRFFRFHHFRKPKLFHPSNV